MPVPLKDIKKLAQKNDNKIVLLVMDGGAGIPVPEKGGMTEFEAAKTPNLDELTKDSILGMAYPVAPGITPGSGPGHLGIFGYNPLDYEFGRGILEALGAGMEVKKGDVAIRGNFITVDENGIITDRRAGRIPDEIGQKMVEKLKSEIKKIDDVEVIISHVKEYKFAVIFRGEGLGDKVNDTDPQKVGLKPLEPQGEDEPSKKTAQIAKKFLEKAFEVLKNEHPANGCTLRGFALKPDIPPMQEVFKLNPAAIATYPMYKGISKLVGMEVLKVDSVDIADEVKTLKENWDKYDFFYVHIKKTDSYGEDGNFDAKVHIIEEVDEKVIPALMELNPTVIAITCDHSTPSLLKGHSWHPVPFLLHSPYERKDDTVRFTEKEAMKGGLGNIYAVDEMPMMLAAALKLKKFGA